MSKIICRILVPWDIQLTSPNQRHSWQAKARIARKARETARVCWIAAGKPTSTLPVVVDIVIRRQNPVDGDNAIAAIKNLRDGIFCKGLTPDDTIEWVTIGVVQQETGKRFARCAEVEFIVRER